MNDTARLYTRYALALLALTLLAGVYLRAAFTWPAARGGMHGPYMVHAHSHAGFFGWAVLGACAVVTARMTFSRAAALLHRGLAHAIGIGSVAAFVGFGLRGYDMTTIRLSALHVLLWVAFVAAVWGGVRAATPAARTWLRAGLGFLVLSGAATVAPVVMMFRGTSDPWLLQLGVKLFLTPFVTGFLVLTALGVLYERVRAPRYATTALVLIALGTLPSTLLYTPAAPPADWLIWLGRAAIGMVGAGTLLALADVLRAVLAPASGAARHGGAAVRPTLPPLAWLVITAAAAKAGLELLAAAGVGAAFMHNRFITIAVLHVVLLGVVTPAFLLALRPRLLAPWRTAAYGAGLLLMAGALGVAGWPWAARLLVASGVPFNLLFPLAFFGGAASAVALLALLLPLLLPSAEPAAAAVTADTPPARPGRPRQPA
jgi:hypothetical protein